MVERGDEVCDGLDNDCDEEIDEEFPDMGEACGSDEGECQVGLWACVEGERVCQGAVEPAPEVCDGLDNDCNGQIDDVDGGCDCNIGTVEPCGLDEGECVVGERACIDGIWGQCEGGQGPVDETCDGLDNDCDGQIDEEFPDMGEVCGSDLGLCESGTLACENGEKVCAGEVPPVEEICDGLDNDCDGEVDEDDPGGGDVCGSDVGECSLGVLTCIETELVCAGEVGPAEEVCDGRDNDCNGEIDESFPNEGRACGTNEGECQMGFGVCEQGEEICQDEVGPVEEVCDGLDNDCNGMIDDVQGGCDCVAGDSELCGSDVGLCERGIRHCNDGVWGQCEGEVGPVQEVCDEDDNDCDGMIDEEFPGMGDPCGSDIGSCEQGSLACVGGEEVCQGQVGPSDEICDGLDNDCDEEIDEGGDDWCAREQGDGFLCVQGECRYDCPDDDFEENDTIAEAHALPEPDSFDATVCVGDDDFFVIDVCEHAELEISTAFDADLGDLDMQLLDSEGNEVASSTGAGSEEHIELGEMEPGLYYLRVYLFSPCRRCFGVIIVHAGALLPEGLPLQRRGAVIRPPMEHVLPRVRGGR